MPCLYLKYPKCDFPTSQNFAKKKSPQTFKTILSDTDIDVDFDFKVTSNEEAFGQRLQVRTAVADLKKKKCARTIDSGRKLEQESGKCRVGFMRRFHVFVTRVGFMCTRVGALLHLHASCTQRYAPSYMCRLRVGTCRRHPTNVDLV